MLGVQLPKSLSLGMRLKVKVSVKGSAGVQKLW